MNFTVDSKCQDCCPVFNCTGYDKMNKMLQKLQQEYGKHFLECRASYLSAHVYDRGGTDFT